MESPQESLSQAGVPGGAVQPRAAEENAADAKASLTYQQMVLAKEPVGYWRLGEQPGECIHDLSDNHHDGKPSGDIACGQAGPIPDDPNTAMGFNGVDTYIEVPSHPDFSQPTHPGGMTVEVWLRPDCLTFDGEPDPPGPDKPYIHWLGKGENGCQEWALRFYNRKDPDKANNLCAYIFNLEGGLGAGAHVKFSGKPGDWTHVVACYEPGNATTPGRPGVRLFVNGVSQGAPDDCWALYNYPGKWKIMPAHGCAPLRFGTRQKKAYLTGGLDEVAIYPRLLSDAEIRKHYEARNGSPVTP